MEVSRDLRSDPALRRYWQMLERERKISDKPCWCTPRGRFRCSSADFAGQRTQAWRTCLTSRGKYISETQFRNTILECFNSILGRHIVQNAIKLECAIRCPGRFRSVIQDCRGRICWYRLQAEVSLLRLSIWRRIEKSFNSFPIRFLPNRQLSRK